MKRVSETRSGIPAVSGSRGARCGRGAHRLGDRTGDANSPGLRTFPDVAAPAPVTLALLPDYRVQDGVESRQQTVERSGVSCRRRPPGARRPVAGRAGGREATHAEGAVSCSRGRPVVEQKSVRVPARVRGAASPDPWRVGETIQWPPRGRSESPIGSGSRWARTAEGASCLKGRCRARATTVQPVPACCGGRGPARPGAPVRGASPEDRPRAGGPASVRAPATARAPGGGRPGPGSGPASPATRNTGDPRSSSRPACRACRAGGGRSGGTVPARPYPPAALPSAPNADAFGAGPGLGRGLSPACSSRDADRQGNPMRGNPARMPARRRPCPRPRPR